MTLAEIQARKRALAEEAAGQRARLAGGLRTLDKPVRFIESGWRLAHQLRGVAGMVAALALSSAARSAPRAGSRVLPAAAVVAAGVGRWLAARWTAHRARQTRHTPRGG